MLFTGRRPGGRTSVPFLVSRFPLPVRAMDSSPVAGVQFASERPDGSSYCPLPTRRGTAADHVLATERPEAEETPARYPSRPMNRLTSSRTGWFALTSSVW